MSDRSQLSPEGLHARGVSKEEVTMKEEEEIGAGWVKEDHPTITDTWHETKECKTNLHGNLLAFFHLMACFGPSLLELKFCRNVFPSVPVIM